MEAPAHGRLRGAYAQCHLLKESNAAKQIKGASASGSVSKFFGPLKRILVTADVLK